MHKIQRIKRIRRAKRISRVIKVINAISKTETFSPLEWSVRQSERAIKPSEASTFFAQEIEQENITKKRNDVAYSRLENVRKAREYTVNTLSPLDMTKYQRQYHETEPQLRDKAIAQYKKNSSDNQIENAVDEYI